MEESTPHFEELTTLFKVLSKPNTIKILFLSNSGISSSKNAMDELNLTQKIFYSRLKELLESGLINKVDGSYRQTPLGEMMCSRFLPAMERACEVKDKLVVLAQFDGTQLERGVRKILTDELDIPDFSASSKLKMLESYEALAIEAIDLCDSSEESMILASNYFDVRVMESTFRSVDRGVINSIIIGKRSLSSKVNQLRMMLSPGFAKAIMNFTSLSVDLKEFVRFVDLPYTFAVVDGHYSVIEISNNIDDTFIFALSIDDWDVGKKLTNLYEQLWETGSLSPVLNILNSLKLNKT